ncbi:MAG: hypothetical protein QM528_07115 [Phycisphaerales bacterium]|nr:hypothetical protein [Phycisphaerales bacterium]
MKQKFTSLGYNLTRSEIKPISGGSAKCSNNEGNSCTIPGDNAQQCCGFYNLICCKTASDSTLLCRNFFNCCCSQCYNCSSGSCDSSC